MALKNRGLKIAVIALTALILYTPAIRAGFAWDDAEFVGNRRMTAGADGLRQMWITDQPRDYFPVTGTSFWIEWRLWGLNPTGYHVTNVLLHALAAILLWQAIERLSVPCAWLAGLVFVAHPVNVESVAWSRNARTHCRWCSAPPPCSRTSSSIRVGRGAGTRWRSGSSSLRC